MRRLSAAGRILIGWLFVHSGWRVLAKPGAATSLAVPSLARLRARVPLVPADDVVIVRANAVLHIAAGSLLMSGRTQRLSSLVLAMSLVPTTAAGHAFWNVTEPAQRRMQRSQFDKNVAVFGGLLVAAGARHQPNGRFGRARTTRRAEVGSRLPATNS